MEDEDNVKASVPFILFQQMLLLSNNVCALWHLQYEYPNELNLRTFYEINLLVNLTEEENSFSRARTQT